MKTRYAPSERSALTDIIKDNQNIEQFHLISDLLNSLPYIAIILNSQRQIVYYNETVLSSFNGIELNHILGERPGETLKCVFANNKTGGCGTTEACRYCGAVNAILESQKKGEKVSMECRITSRQREELVFYDFLVSSSPFKLNNNEYYVFTLNDISSQKRKETLEKIFFHDLINKIGNLNGFFELIKSDINEKEKEELLIFASQLSQELIDEVLSQRTLLAAENNELQTNVEEFHSLEVLRNTVNQFKYNSLILNKNIEIDKDSRNVLVKSDPVLVKRVLTNMLKNALEAAEENEKVRCGCSLSGNYVIYWSNNKMGLPEEIKLQIFQRSFSTKGAGRGLGTYSMKLISEKYLNAHITFTSNEKDGTTFYLKIPL